jgi:8-oxo-dGTP pyrophosphatase MutT (NUDIX family)
MGRRKKRKVQVWVWHRAENGRLRVLILKTRPDRGGFWQPVTGGVERGEGLRAAALREACEETAIRTLGKPRTLRFTFEFQSRWGDDVSEHGFELEARGDGSAVPPPFRIDPSEHVKGEWVTVVAARRKIRFESNRKLLEVLVRKLT